MSSSFLLYLPAPSPAIWSVLSERLVELGGSIEDVERVECVSRETRKGVVRCVHVWQAKTGLPPLLALQIDPSALQWRATTEWIARDRESRWSLEPDYWNGRIRCESVLRFTSVLRERATQMSVASSMRGIAQRGLEITALHLVASGFRKLAAAAMRQLEVDAVNAPAGGAGTRRSRRPPTAPNAPRC